MQIQAESGTGSLCMGERGGCSKSSLCGDIPYDIVGSTKNQVMGYNFV
jgi:hypothetical protein